MQSFDPVWDEIYGSGQQLNRYPFSSVVTFLFRNRPRDKDRAATRILEVGCGAGNNLWFAAREGFDVSGIDASEPVIDHARKWFDAEGLNADLRVADMALQKSSEHDVDGGPSTTQTVGHLRMKGREVFRHAVVNLADVLKEVLDETGKSAADIDWVVPHQANARILDATARKLELPVEKIVVTVDRHANTSAASVPLALDTAMRDGRIQPGDLVMFEAMGGGFTWGASLVRF